LSNSGFLHFKAILMIFGANHLKLFKPFSSLALLCIGLGILSSNNALASVIISYAEAPGQQGSLLSGVSTFTFDGVANGYRENVAFNPGGTTLGTYDRLSVSNANRYGGANGSKFSTVTGSVTTLTLNSDIGYFGLWWSAGDAANILQFYNGNDLVANFTTSSVLGVLPDAYKGNPNPAFLGQASNEAFAYLNFFGSSSSVKWDRVVITNSGNSGFESDNHSIRAATWNRSTDGEMPGVVFGRVTGNTYESITEADLNAVPEPGTMSLAGVVCCGLVLLHRKGRKLFQQQ
jgi:hypothetical protein